MSVNTKDYHRYLAVGRREEAWGLYVTAAGFEAIGPGEPYPRPVHPRGYSFSWDRGRILSEYQAQFITRGQGEFESHSAGRARVSHGSVIILFPGEWHRYRPARATGWHGYWVSFGGAVMDRLVENGFFDRWRPVLSTGVDSQLVHAYQVLLDRMRTEPHGFGQLTAASVFEILAAALGAVSYQRIGDENIDAMRQARAMLETHGDRPPAIAELARAVGLSPTHFHRLFKRHTGLSPYQYYQQLRISRAQRLLQGSALTVKEIAAQLGFETPFHFSHAFKARTGQSPDQFRRQTLRARSGDAARVRTNGEPQD